MFDTDAYLARVHLPARPTTDQYGLAAIQRAHRLAIPFENLDILLGRGIPIDSAAVFAKLVTARRGGYCFEQNRLFLDALAAFGFVARPLLARVLIAATDVTPLTHTLALIDIEGAWWIADAGFGGSYAPVLPLVDGAEGEAPDGARFLLRCEGDTWMLLRDGAHAATDGRGGGTGLQPQFAFDLRVVEPADLAMSNHWTSTAPASRFLHGPVVSIVLPHGFASLTGGRYRRYAAGEETDATITDPRVYRLRLSMMFGIDLTAQEVGRIFPGGA